MCDRYRHRCEQLTNASARASKDSTSSNASDTSVTQPRQRRHDVSTSVFNETRISPTPSTTATALAALELATDAGVGVGAGAQATEPRPENSARVAFWQMRLLRQSIMRGGFLTPELYIAVSFYLSCRTYKIYIREENNKTKQEQVEKQMTNELNITHTYRPIHGCSQVQNSLVFKSSYMCCPRCFRCSTSWYMNCLFAHMKA